MKIKQKQFKRTISIFAVVVVFSFFVSPVLADYWGSMDQLTPGAQTIFADLGGATKIYMQIYNNKPKIVLQGVNSSDGGAWAGIYYTEWSGSAWTKADGTAGYDTLTVTLDSHDEPILHLDSQGRPHVIFRDKTLNKIIYKRWSGTAWVSAEGGSAYDGLGTDSAVLDFALDSNDKPQIIWRQDNPLQIYFIKWSSTLGEWTHADGQTSGPEKITNFTVPNSLIAHLRIYNNQPYVVSDGVVDGKDQVVFTRWSPDLNSWVQADGQTVGLENVSQAVVGAERPSFEFDRQGNIKIAWAEYVADKKDIFYSQWTVAKQAWTKADGQTAGKENLTNTDGIMENVNGGVGRNDILKLDYLGWPKIIFGLVAGSGKNQIGYTQYTPGIGWTQADGLTVSPSFNNLSDDLNLTATSTFAVLALDSNGSPAIVWTDDFLGYKDVFYTKWSAGVGWSQANSTAGYDNISNSIAGDINYQAFFELNSVNNPIVLFRDNKSGTNFGYFTAWSQADQEQVTISASVDSTLSINIPQASCTLGDFDVYKLKTCSYRLVINTNASLGYVAYVRASGTFGSADHDMADTSNSKVQAQTEAYGVATTKSGEDIILINDANNDSFQNENDCAFLNNQDNSVWLEASVLSTTAQSFASSSGPVNNDITYLCHGVSLSGTTPAGTYHQTTIITVVNHY